MGVQRKLGAAVLAVALLACGGERQSADSGAGGQSGAPGERDAAPPATVDAGTAGSAAADAAPARDAAPAVDAGAAGTGAEQDAATDAAIGDDGAVLPGDDAAVGAGAACSDGSWTIVAVDAADSYETHAFQVPAAQNWVNTGLFLQAGQQASVAETGSWAINNDEGPAIDHGPCIVGQLVARIGLHYKDPNLTCVDGAATITADKDGILFVGALAGNDLGETYETRNESTGAKTVTVTTSSGATAPTFDGASVTAAQLSAVQGGAVELTGEHVIVTLPTATARADVATIAAAVARLDAIYELHEELRGARPHRGQCLRFFPDGTQPGYMLSGNPIRMALSLVDAGDANRITRAGESGTDVWGFAHEMGHDFTMVNRVWQYQDNSLESWPNVFSVHALTRLDVPLRSEAAACNESSSGSYTDWDAWGGLCFLLQFQYRYGWEFYAAFFRALNGYSHSQVPGGQEGWHFVHDLFEQTAGTDVTPLFVAWDVPNPG